MAFSKITLDGTTLTKETFQQPPKELGILPFWFWNGQMDEQEMEWQLREYKSKGIPGVFIHGRFGLSVPYISDAWFEKVKFAVRKARELGIDLWVYDEMNWPSGTAGRQVLEDHADLCQRYLELVALTVEGPLFTFLEATDNRYVNTGDSYPIAAFGCTEEEWQTGILHPIDLTQNLSFEKVIPWEAPPGKWRLLYFLEKRVPYYIDALNPESTARFLELTHERYKRAVGEEFGRTVPGFYTDEPAMHYYHVGVDNFVVPWTKHMFRIFRERRGYELRAHLPALFARMGEETERVRYDFWHTLSEQYSDSYYGQIRRWCDENGVVFTGHLLFEEWLRMHARCEGNLFSHLKQMHMIGVDHLYPKIGTKEEPDQHVALKIASSAAHHFGSTRLLCESMGGAYWDCTLERMKWIADWEYVLGVNLFNNHGYHYSIEGERKRDWPPSQFYHHTWWKHYERFTTYVNRLSHVLSGGRHVAKVLMLYPLSTVWANYLPQTRTEAANAAEQEFTYLTDALLRLHYDFDYVDEDVLSESAVIGNGLITIRDEEYSVLILPPVTHLKRSSFAAIKRFTASGGHVIASALLPVEFLETGRADAAREITEFFGVEPRKLLREYAQNAATRTQAVHEKKHGRGKNIFIGGKGFFSSKADRLLKRLLNDAVSPDVTIASEKVFYLHRRKDGKDLYFLVNTSTVPVDGVELSFEQCAKPELWNAETGEAEPVHSFAVKKGRLVMRLDFAACGSHIVVLEGALEKAKRQSRRAAKTLPALPPLALGAVYDFGLEEDNTLAIGRWKMTIGTKGVDALSASVNFAAPAYDDSAWLSVTNGAWEMQLPAEREASVYPVTLFYRTRFEIDHIPERLALLVDGFAGRAHRLFINGCLIAGAGTRSALDAEIRSVDIRSFVRTGTNVVAVELEAARRTDGILDLLKLTGPFALKESVRGKGDWRIVKPERRIAPGDWTKKGYPFYSGTAVYRREITIPKKYCQGRLTLELECGEDVLEVSVNGSAGRVIPWHPYRMDVTALVHPGKNMFELKVTNTLINMLEAVRKPSGLFTQPKLVHDHV